MRKWFLAIKTKTQPRPVLWYAQILLFQHRAV